MTSTHETGKQVSERDQRIEDLMRSIEESCGWAVAETDVDERCAWLETALADAHEIRVLVAQAIDAGEGTAA